MYVFPIRECGATRSLPLESEIRFRILRYLERSLFFFSSSRRRRRFVHVAQSYVCHVTIGREELGRERLNSRSRYTGEKVYSGAEGRGGKFSPGIARMDVDIRTRENTNTDFFFLAQILTPQIEDFIDS